MLETAWKSGPDAERGLWKGLAQLAVGLTHARRGNAVGAVSLPRRGCAGIVEFADRLPHTIAVARLISTCDQLADRIETRGLGTVSEQDMTARLR